MAQPPWATNRGVLPRELDPWSLPLSLTSCRSVLFMVSTDPLKTCITVCEFVISLPPRSPVSMCSGNGNVKRQEPESVLRFVLCNDPTSTIKIQYSLRSCHQYEQLPQFGGADMRSERHTLVFRIPHALRRGIPVDTSACSFVPPAVRSSMHLPENHSAGA